MNLEIEVKSRSTVKFCDIADFFAYMGHQEQAVFIHELFDALSFKCKEYSKKEYQIMYIAKYLKEQNLKETIHSIKTLSDFFED